jgi:P-type Ca2+ transporter type 2C
MITTNLAGPGKIISPLPHKHQSGLSQTEVLEQRRRFGENTLPQEKGISPFIIFLNQFKSPLVYIILVTAGVSLAVGEYGDFAIIMAVVVLDAVLGFFQEYQAMANLSRGTNWLSMKPS